MTPAKDAADRDDRVRIVDTIFLLLALSAVMFLSAGYGRSMDEDIWWHLRTGHWILAHHAVPVTDSFSAKAMGQPWIAYSWLFETMVSGIFDTWGYRGMLALTSCWVFAYVAWMTVFLSRFANIRRATILSFAAYAAMMPMKSPRPWLFTILFFTVELTLLWLARERNRPAWLLAIVPLFVVWANMHIQFVYGLGLIGMFALDSSLPEKVRTALSAEARPALRAKWLWWLLGACLAATLVNPYGWNLYRVVWQYATQSAPLSLVSEMQALPFRTPSNWMMLTVVGGAMFVLGCAREKNLLMISLMVVSCYCGFRSQRDLWFPVTVAVLALAQGSLLGEPDFIRSRCVWWIVLPVGLAISLGVLSVDPRFSDAALRKAVAKDFPVEASRFIESHRLAGPLFNSYGWGGYLIWRLPELPVSIDGRANLYESSLSNSVNTIHGGKSWFQDPDLKKARTILLEKDLALASLLRIDPNYRVLYTDETATVFEPVNPPR